MTRKIELHSAGGERIKILFYLNHSLIRMVEGSSHDSTSRQQIRAILIKAGLARSVRVPWQAVTFGGKYWAFFDLPHTEFWPEIPTADFRGLKKPSRSRIKATARLLGHRAQPNASRRKGRGLGRGGHLQVIGRGRGAQGA
jgi:hypothetical protein